MKGIVIALAISIFCTTPASAFEITQIVPDAPCISTNEIDLEGDKEYVKSIAEQYRMKYAVCETDCMDISSINHFFMELSAPITLLELQAANLNLDLGIIQDKRLRKTMKDFKVLAGTAGYSASFEQIIGYSIDRNIGLIGGYIRYENSSAAPEDAAHVFISYYEEIAKETLPPFMREKVMSRIRELSDYMHSDKTIKIFILKNGELDSMYERSKSVGND